MKLEQQVVSLELAQKLKELGVKQESFLYHRNWDGDRWEINYSGAVTPEGKLKCFSAYTVAELGEMLPLELGREVTEERTTTYLLDTRRMPSGWYIRYLHSDTSRPFMNQLFFQAYTEADARAKMLIYLAENGLLKN